MENSNKNIENAESYYVPAKGYLESSKYLFASPYRISHGMTLSFLPMNLLLAFSVELYLKSWLAYCGYPKTKLRNRAYGHDLNRLYGDCLLNKMEPNEDLESIVNFYYNSHLNFQYRYFEANVDLPYRDFLEIIKTIDELDGRVDKFIGASARPRADAKALDMFLLIREGHKS